MSPEDYQKLVDKLKVNPDLAKVNPDLITKETVESLLKATSSAAKAVLPGAVSAAQKTADMIYTPTLATKLILSMGPTTDEAQLNKTERAFYRYLLSLYPKVWVQCFTLKLGNDTRYTPDFFTIGPNGEGQFWETKGFMRDDAFVKLKIAARLYSMFEFRLVMKTKAKAGGGWDIQPVKP